MVKSKISPLGYLRLEGKEEFLPEEIRAHAVAHGNLNLEFLVELNQKLHGPSKLQASLLIWQAKLNITDIVIIPTML